MFIKKKLLLTSTIGGLLSLTSFASYADVEAVRANLSRLKVPAGFTVDIYAEVPNARQMALGTTGTVFVGTRGNHVYAVVDKNKDHQADEVVSLMDDLKVGNGVAMHNGFLYVAEQHRISRYPAVDFDLTLPFKMMREVIYDQLPDHPHHGWRYITFGPDNKLYSTVGAPCNICAPKDNEASIIRMEDDGSQAEIFAEGIRNSVGMDFLPGTNTLYFTDNGVDMMGDDTPPGELNAATKPGQHFGFPFYAGGTDRQKDWKDKTAPINVTFPSAEFQAHSANLGFKFYTGDQFPAEFKGNAIIAQHGSWNRNEPVGYQLQRITFDDKQQVVTNDAFISGWLDNGEVWGRPTDVLQLADGSLLVSDDYNGVIYRISYGEQLSIPSAALSNTQKVTGLVLPESVVAHPDGRTFISEIGGFGTDGDGTIKQINANGSVQVLVKGLNDPKGLDLFNNQLYVADINQVLRIDLEGKKVVVAKPTDFPHKPTFLNDLEIDGQGNVYVSDSGNDEGQGSAIFMIDTSGKVSQITDDKSGIKRPNGLLIDGPNRLLVADFATGDLFRVSFPTPSGKAKTHVEKINSGFGQIDGLVRDTDGVLYVSDWGTGKLWQLIDPKSTPQLIHKVSKSAADISLSSNGKFLLVPDLKSGELLTLKIR